MSCALKDELAELYFYSDAIKDPANGSFLHKFVKLLIESSDPDASLLTFFKGHKKKTAIDALHKKPTKKNKIKIKKKQKKMISHSFPQLPS